MNSSALVSIQIPTYNQKKYIKEAFDSALNQTYTNKQIIVSDDSSPEYDIFEFFKDSINLSGVFFYKNTINLGRVGNYNNTLYNHVKGDFFLNLDGDDFFTDNNFIEYGVKLLIENEKLNPLFFQGNHDIEKIKKIVPHSIIDEFTIIVNSREYLKSYIRINEFSHAATLFNTAKAKKIGFYNFDCVFSDFNSAARLMLLYGTLLISSKKGAHWRQHESNETWSLNISNYKNEISGIKNIFKDESSFEFKKIEKELKNKIFNSVIAKQDKIKFNFNQFYFLLFTFQFSKNYFYMILRYLLIKLRIKKVLN